MVHFLFFPIFLLIGAPCAQSTLYELHKNGSACLVLNATIQVTVAYLQSTGKTNSATWTLTESFKTTGVCDSETKGIWSQLTLGTTEAGFNLSMVFVNRKPGGVSLSNVSLVVAISNGTRFVNPNTTGLMALASQPNLALTPDTNHRFVCPSDIQLDLTGPVHGSRVSLSGGVVIQAFGLQDGRLSNNATVCDTYLSTTEKPTSTIVTTATTKPKTTTTPKPTTTPEPTTTPKPTTTPSSDAPLLNLTLTNQLTNTTCLRMRARLQITVRYLAPGRIASSVIPIRQDAVAAGLCGNGSSEQTLWVTFFEKWRLTLKMAKPDLNALTYALTYAQLDYSLTNRAIFPGATDTGRNLTALANDTGSAVSGAPGNATYFACSQVSLVLKAAATPQEPEVTLDLTMRDLALQAFTSDYSGGGSDQFPGDRRLCSADSPKDNVVPIAVGAALAGLIVLVLLAYLISRRSGGQGRGRAEYQSV